MADDQVGATAIETDAAINKVTTLADGGNRWTFDVGEDTSYESAWLMEVRRMGQGVRLRIERIP